MEPADAWVMGEAAASFLPSFLSFFLPPSLPSPLLPYFLISFLPLAAICPGRAFRGTSVLPLIIAFVGGLNYNK